MILIFIDPYSSGLQVINCNKKANIKKVLKENDIDKYQCAGETIYYVFVDKDGTALKGVLDFS